MTMKRYAVLLVMIFLLLNAVSLLAQDATPESTPEPALAAGSEATVEATLEPTTEATAEALSPIGQLFASLPQTRQPDGGFVVGQPSAPITVIEFIDYACPHCQEYRPMIDQMLMQYLPAGQIKYELRLFPTAGGELSYDVDLLVECAEKQRAGSFWQAYDLLYGLAMTGKYDQNVGKRMAAALNVNYSKMLDCAQTATQVNTDVAFGEGLNVGGTPAVMVRLGDTPPQFITLHGVTYDRGGVPSDVLDAVIDAVNGIQVTPEATGQVLMNFGAVKAF